jgi:hypothetical protein
VLVMIASVHAEILDALMEHQAGSKLTPSLVTAALLIFALKRTRANNRGESSNSDPRPIHNCHGLIWGHRRGSKAM